MERLFALLAGENRSAHDVIMGAGAWRLGCKLRDEGWPGEAARDIALEAMIEVMSELPNEPFTAKDFDERLESCLKKARHARISQLEEGRIEMADAAKVQRKLQQVETLVDGLEVYWRGRALTALSGDFFRIVKPLVRATERGTPSVWLAFGDARAHGASAALSASLAVGRFEGLVEGADGLADPAVILSALADLAHRSGPKEEHICLSLIGWWPEEKHLVFCHAGMWPILRIHAHGASELGGKGLAIGLTLPKHISVPDYVSEQYDLDADELLVLVSDGIAELSWKDEFYFHSRLSEVCRQYIGRPLPEIAHAVMEEVQSDADDDQSILLIRLRPNLAVNRFRDNTIPREEHPGNS
jgi:serine phosphatase RsbU (regulator of sigma subunit)